MSNETQTIAQLWRDIAEMESTVLYFQNRILQKRIAIAEIVQSSVVAAESAKAEEPVPTSTNKTVREMVEELIAEGAPLNYYVLREMCYDRWPDEHERIRVGMFCTTQRMVQDGIAIQMPRKRNRAPSNRFTAKMAMALEVNGHGANGHK